MTLIDEDGNLFGKVNVLDALVIVLVVAGAIGVAGLLLNGETADREPVERTIEVEADGVQPYVADAISEGSVDDSDVVAVLNKTVEPTKTVVEVENGTLYERPHPNQKTVSLRITVKTTRKQDELLFQGEPLKVGQTADFDLGQTVVEATVTRIVERDGSSQ